MQNKSIIPKKLFTLSLILLLSSFVNISELQAAKVQQASTESELNKAIAQAKSKNTTVVAEFFADWCGHCKKMAVPFDKAAQDFDDLIYVKINAGDKNNSGAKDLASKHGVRGFPTFVFLDGNGKVVDQFSGSSEEKLQSLSKKYSKKNK